MEKYARIRICIRTVAILVAAAVVATACVLLIGCSEGGGISFDRDGITLFVGEARDIFPYVRFLPSTARDKTVDVAADGECVDIIGTKVKAVSCGESVVTVRGNGGEAALKVTVAYRDPQMLGIEMIGELNQSVKDIKAISPIEFIINTDYFADPELIAEWCVDGAAVAVGNSFTYTPSGYGEYEISVAVGGLTAKRLVRIYRPTKTIVTCVGEMEQDGTFTEVRYTAEQKTDPDNPRSVYEWFINGEIAGVSPVFAFTPSAAGEYNVSLSVNGDVVEIDEDISVVTARGLCAPTCSVEFDDENSVYVQWDCDGVYRVSIISPDGKRRDFDLSDAQYAYLFERNRLDATDYIEVCAQNPDEYDITVWADGKSEFKFAQYPLEAEMYLGNKPFYKNLFVSSDADGCELIDDIYASGITEFSCYTAHGAVSAVDTMRSYAMSLGLVVSVSVNGSVAAFDFAPYINEPTRFDAQPTPAVTRMYTELPHIEYDGAKRRTSSHVFAIDRIRKGVEVNTSEQLVTTALRGLRPEPKKGSVAEVVYSAARTRLLGIIGAKYTAAQKVHAIYDWLQWVTIGVPSADRNAASNYVESVFGMAVIQGGDARRTVVTSEGAAKVFALMCSIEGIECMMPAVNDGGSLYMSNKVNIDGLWYNVDVLAGKASKAELDIQVPSNTDVQLCTHRALLIDDKAAANMGLFTAGGEYRAFDDELCVYRDKVKTDGAYLDKYISATDAVDYDALREVVFYAFSRCALGSVSVPVLAGIETYMNTTLGVELEIDADVDESDVQKTCELLTKAADEYAKSVFGKNFAKNAVRIYHIQNKIHLVASTTGMTA